MNQITAEEFKRKSEEDPSWCTKLTEPLEIIGAVDMDDSPITHLSPHLRFKEGVWSFRDCQLELVAGTFEVGPVVFNGSGIKEIHPDFTIECGEEEGMAGYFEECFIGKLQGTYHGGIACNSAEIEEIGKLEVPGTGDTSCAANFDQVQRLRVARGKFAGFVEFCQSSIEEIDGDPTTGLIVTHADKVGQAANFSHCEYLKIARGYFAGAVEFRYAGIEEIDTNPETGLRIVGTNEGKVAADFFQCRNLAVLDGTFPGTVIASESGVQKISPTFHAEKTYHGIACRLGHTPVFKQDPIRVGEITFQTKKGDLKALEQATLDHYQEEGDVGEQILKAIEKTRKARKAMKAPDIEL